jgi:hypothetical protein
MINSIGIIMGRVNIAWWGIVVVLNINTTRKETITIGAMVIHNV